MSSLLEDRQLKYIKTGIELVKETVKSVLEHMEGEERQKYLESQKDQVLSYLKLELEYTTGKEILKNLQKHLETKEGTMDTDMVAEYKKRYAEEIELKSEELKPENLKKNNKYLDIEQIITNKLGGGLDDDEDLVCAEEENQTYIDPWSKKRIETPVRNKSCSHVYDKSTAMKMISRSKGKVRCPVVGCGNNNLKSTDLEVDQKIMKIIESQMD